MGVLFGAWVVLIVQLLCGPTWLAIGSGQAVYWIGIILTAARKAASHE